MMRSLQAAGKWAGMALLLTLAACKPSATQDEWHEWAPVPNAAAEYFRLLQRGPDRMLVTFGPGGVGDTTGIFILSAHAGNGPAQAVHLPGALERVALLSTTHASFISALGQAESVVGCAHLDRLRDPLVAVLARAGKITEIGSAEGVDREKVLMLAPGALFVYPYGAEANVAALGPLPVIPVAEYLERTPLGRAEWIRAFGMLLGQEERATEVFNGIVGRYEQAQARVPAKGKEPRVFFGSSWKGTWSVPSGHSYMARLIADAGGHYLFAGREASGNIDVDLEQVLQVGLRADFWGRIMDLGRPVGLPDVAGDDGRILGLPVFKGHGAFYANSRESDIFGQAGLEPDVVLMDLIQVFHPELAEDREPVYFRTVQ